MNKLLILLSVILVVVSLTTVVSAETFRQSLETDFTKTCTNSSGSRCSSGANCELTLKFPRNNSQVFTNSSMGNNANGLFNYTLSAGDVGVLGNYNWDMFCCDGLDCGEAHGSFLVTRTGVELSQDKAMVYLGMLGLVILLFIAVCIAIPFLPSGNNRSEEEFFISINNLKYLRPVLYAVAWGLLLAIMFTSSNISYLYLETEMMGGLLFAGYSIMMWLSIPMVFVWFLFILVNMFRDKEMRKLIERGVQISSTP